MGDHSCHAFSSNSAHLRLEQSRFRASFWCLRVLNAGVSNQLSFLVSALLFEHMAFGMKLTFIV